MKRLKKTLRDMARITNGRIAYLLHKGEPIFVLRKVKATIPTIDWEKGETKMRQQYLIDLDVVVDPLEVAREYSTEKMLEKGDTGDGPLTPAAEDPGQEAGRNQGRTRTSPSGRENGGRGGPGAKEEPTTRRRRLLRTRAKNRKDRPRRPRRTATGRNRWTLTRGTP